MQRFEEGQLKNIAATARHSVEGNLEKASSEDKTIFVQVECTRAIVEAIQGMDIQGAKNEVIAEIRKIPRPKQGRRGIERGGLIAIVVGVAVGIYEFLTRVRN